MQKDNKEKIKEIIKRSDQFIVICGPSGSGKTMVAKHLVDNYDFIETPFITTRELRPGEKEIGSIRVTRDEFMEKSVGDSCSFDFNKYVNHYGYKIKENYTRRILASW